MRRGFTLIELLIVVAIIAILAAIAVPNFLEAQTRAKVSRSRADLRSTATALESYRVDNNNYPPMSDYYAGSTWDVFNDITLSPLSNDDHARIPSYLTTPVSYMSSLVYDPFIPHTTLNSTYPHIVEIGKRYVYFNFDQWLADPEYANSTSFLTRKADAGNWLMYSYGPDRDPFNLQGAVYINYDATNGTISPGNIFRTQRTTDQYQRV
jgi:prepilin-type N-terminal cleavage/methylation domain-containing protein